MLVDFKDEYIALRQEMLERFDRIHDAMKYGTGAFIIFLSYYYTTKDFDNFISLTILQLLVALIGLYSLSLYQSIYKVGTYIAVIIEDQSEAKWHRMSRQFDLYSRNIMTKKWTNGLPFPFGYRWGTDSTMLALLLISLLIITIGAVLLKVESLPAFQPSLVSHWIKLSIIGFLLLFNVIIIYQLIWGMRNFMHNNVETWKKYRSSFGNDFTDIYSELEVSPDLLKKEGKRI